jgi:hypothetical protein
MLLFLDCHIWSYAASVSVRYLETNAWMIKLGSFEVAVGLY